MAGKKKNTYMTHSTYGDLAYDLDYAERIRRLEHAGEALPKEEQQQREEFIRPPQKKAQPKPKTAARPKYALLSPAAFMLSTAVLAILLMTVFGYIALDRVSGEVAELKTTYNELKQENVDLKTKHELTFDLAGVKDTAEAAGMAKPSNSQIFYIDLAGEDNAVVYTPKKSGLASLRALAGEFFHTVAEYFH